ncbi:acyl-CoA dehydrogenase family protein [Streptomyces fulvoviolaceus]|uniref:acyl-CoA dehydrogenase family protein n=1 Tax=Streptomyces fulvoviolaceus TaxID=285535 RepID=UPI000AF9E90B|nr:acyl-CoA dehydrogenase family protein [Streptomyces fulvoviolaceus]
MAMPQTPPRPVAGHADRAELADLRALARTFFETVVMPHEERFEQQGRPDREMYRRAGELGLLCMSVPTEYGGGGGTFEHEAVLFEEQTRAGESALQLGVDTGIVPHYLLHYATHEQRLAWIPKLASGEWIGAIAMTEPATGSDLKNIRTRAVRDGDEYVVTGAKTFISNGATCDLLIIAAVTDPGAGARGISLLVAEVDDGPAGFRRGQVLKKIGQKGQDTAELFFDGLRVPARNLLGGTPGSGFAQLMRQLPHERLIVATAAMGMMEAAVEATVAYTKQRQAFGGTLFDLQSTRFTLAEAATTVAVARAFVDACVARHVRGELDATTAAMAKSWTSEQQCRVVDSCLQLFGGYGYMTEYPIARMFVDSRIQKIYAGANEVMKDLIARSL